MTPILILVACSAPVMAPSAVLEPLSPTNGGKDVAPPRVNGAIGASNQPSRPLTSIVASNGFPPATSTPAPNLGNFTLDFTDLDVRDAAAQVLGDILHVNYTIDPAVRGTVTLHTSGTTTRPQLIATLQSLLAANNASLVETAGFYRVLPNPNPGSSSALGAEAGGLPVPLRFASAPELAKVLQPFLQNGGRIAADPASNTLIVGGDASTRDALAALIRAFDVDTLAGQSYALLPVAAGDVQNAATALQAAFRSQSGGALAGVVRVVPMQSINSLLVIASHRTYIEDAKRVYTLIDRMRRESMRGWHVYYLQNSRSNDIAYVLQQAFTPGYVTALPPGTDRSTSPGSRASTLGSGSGTGFGSGSSLGRSGSLGSSPGNSRGNTPAPEPPPATGNDNPDAPLAAVGNPLLGGLGGQSDSMSNSQAPSQSMRIISNNPVNAVLIYGTSQEIETAEAMLRKLDVLPLQVQIEAVIAEVTLNDDLKYGTQFFFKSRGVNVILDNAAQNVTNLAGTGLATQFPGIAVGGSSSGGAPFVLSALQAITQVNVLSSPQILVMDNQPARLQVGQLVPYLTQSGQSTLTSNAPIINSIDYRETGVITEVTPRVNSGGLVTLDIAQEVSNVDTLAPRALGIESPTFFERAVRSRVVVQDGQTIGLAGLIQDSSSRGNQGIPWLKDVPVLSWLAGTQTNARTRTELLVLLTPRVIRDQREARAATEELRAGLPNAAMVPQVLRNLKPSGSSDPAVRVRQRLGLESR